MTRVLVVEDNELNRELVTDLLEAGGYQVFSVGSAEQGLRWAQSMQPDLIMMDIGLPGMDGLTALRLLKSADITCHIPVMVLSAHAMPADERAARAAGCAAYLSKPINTRTLLATVAALHAPDPLSEAA